MVQLEKLRDEEAKCLYASDDALSFDSAAGQFARIGVAAVRFLPHHHSRPRHRFAFR